MRTGLFVGEANDAYYQAAVSKVTYEHEDGRLAKSQNEWIGIGMINDIPIKVSVSEVDKLV